MVGRMGSGERMGPGDQMGSGEGMGLREGVGSGDGMCSGKGVGSGEGVGSGDGLGSGEGMGSGGFSFCLKYLVGCSKSLWSPSWSFISSPNRTFFRYSVSLNFACSFAGTQSLAYCSTSAVKPATAGAAHELPVLGVACLGKPFSMEGEGTFSPGA